MWRVRITCEERLLASSCPSVSPHVSAPLHWTDLSEIWYGGLSWKSIKKLKNVVKVGQKCRELYMNTYVSFIVAGDILLSSTQYFYIVDSDVKFNNTQKTLLRLLCNSGLGEQSTLLRYTYIACLVESWISSVHVGDRIKVEKRAFGRSITFKTGIRFKET